MKPVDLALLIILVAIVGIISYDYYNRTKPTETLKFELPKSRSPKDFGNAYWSAFHTLAHKVPCVFCRGFAEKFIVFFHDTVNMKLGKPLLDKENFDYFTQLYADINAGKNPFVEISPSQH